MKKWLDYQLLAAKIYADLSGDAVVKHDDHIQGVESGTMRQIDVSIRTKIAGHEILIIVQAKDKKRPADVNIIGEFQSVIKDVRAAKGILICSGGFTEKAKDYARKLSIDLCSIYDAQNRNWKVDLTVPIVWLRYDLIYGVQCKFKASPDDLPDTEHISIPSNINEWVLSTDKGTTWFRLYQILQQIWNTESFDKTHAKTYRINSTIPNLRLKSDTNYWCPIVEMNWECTINRMAWLGSFRIPDAQLIHNVLVDEVTAHLHIKSEDLPMQRDETWMLIDDIDILLEKMPNAIIIEEWPNIDENTLNNATFGVQ